MTDLLLDTLDVETAARDLATAQLTNVTPYAGTLPAAYSIPYVLFTVNTPSPQGLIMSGDQDLECTLAWTIVAKDRANAVRTAAAVRTLILGRDRGGAWLHELIVDEHRTVLGRDSLNDGAPDNVDGVPQWSESARLTIGRT